MTTSQTAVAGPLEARGIVPSAGHSVDPDPFADHSVDPDLPADRSAEPTMTFRMGAP